MKLWTAIFWMVLVVAGRASDTNTMTFQVDAANYAPLTRSNTPAWDSFLRLNRYVERPLSASLGSVLQYDGTTWVALSPLWLTKAQADTYYALLSHSHSTNDVAGLPWWMADSDARMLLREPSLGNPAVDGYILSSTASGVRSWVAPASGSTWPGFGGNGAAATASHSDHFHTNMVTGRGVVARLARFNSATNIVSSDIYYHGGDYTFPGSIYCGSYEVSLVNHEHFTNVIVGLPGWMTNIDAQLSGKAATVHNQAWATITNPPATYAPSAHTHATGEVVGLTGWMTGEDAKIALREPGLGNPSTDGYVLSSTASGVRSWVAPATGGGWPGFGGNGTASTASHSDHSHTNMVTGSGYANWLAMFDSTQTNLTTSPIYYGGTYLRAAYPLTVLGQLTAPSVNTGDGIFSGEVTVGGTNVSLHGHTHPTNTITGLPGWMSQVDAQLAGKALLTHNQDWSTITNRPSTFPPATHNHPESDVVNLVGDLANRHTLGSTVTNSLALQNMWPTVTASGTSIAQRDANGSAYFNGLFIPGDNSYASGTIGKYLVKLSSGASSTFIFEATPAQARAGMNAQVAGNYTTGSGFANWLAMFDSTQTNLTTSPIYYGGTYLRAAYPLIVLGQLTAPSVNTGDGIFSGEVTVGGTNVSLHGHTHTTNQIAGLNPRLDDLWTGVNAKEPALGNPPTSGYVLSSTTAGVRSWVANGSGGGVSGSGTSGNIVKFIGGTTIGNSILTESGETITVNSLNGILTAPYLTSTVLGSFNALSVGGDVALTGRVFSTNSNQSVIRGNFRSSDNSAGITTNFTAGGIAWTIKSGLITAVSY